MKLKLILPRLIFFFKKKYIIHSGNENGSSSFTLVKCIHVFFSALSLFVWELLSLINIII